jgi:hypothetical protein
MSNTTIQLRKSGQTGNTPADLAHGELAINYADGKLFYKNGVGIKAIENQKTFSTINANNSLIIATTPTDILNIVPGNNVTISTNTISKTVTINSTATGGVEDTVARELAQGAFTAANTAGSNTVYLQAVNDSQNTNITAVNTFSSSAFDSANAGVNLATASYAQANNASGNTVALQAQMTTTNTNVTSVNTFAQSGFNSANAGVTLAAAAYDQANNASSNTVYLNAVNTLQNTNITSVDTLAVSAFNSANAGVALATSAYGKANAEGEINNTQNTWITNTNTFAQAAYNFANTRFSSSGGTISGNVTIQNDLSVLGNVNFIGNVTSVTVTGNSGQFFGYASNGFNALYAGIPVGYDFQPQTVFQVSANENGYAQINIQNINAGGDASSDLVATADNGTENDTYISVGIGSSQHADPEYTLVGPNDGYLYVSGNTVTGGGDLVFGTILENDIVFAVGGMNTENEQMRIIGSSNTISIRSNVDSSLAKSVLLGPIANLHITGGSTGQLLSTDGSGNLSFINSPADLASAAYAQANNASSNTVAIQAVNDLQNTNITSVNTFAASAFNSANAGVTLATAAFEVANTAAGNTVALQSQMTTTNTNITSVNTFAGSAFNSANAGVTLATAAFEAANTAAGNTVYLQTVNNLQNTNITAVNTFAQAAYDKANTGGGGSDTVAFAAYAQANNASSNTVAIQAVNDLQNTNITSVNTFAQAGFNKANGAVQTGFTTISANDVSITPANNTDTLTITAGNNISISACTTTKTITIASTASGGYSNTDVKVYLESLSNVNIGLSTGNNQGSGAISIGSGAGSIDQLAESIAIGKEAGFSQQNQSAIAIGFKTASYTQGRGAIAVGVEAGTTNQGQYSVAVGYLAGYDLQGNNTIAFGHRAGQYSQSNESVAIGYYAGQNNQGYRSVAIGVSAGLNNQAANSIIISANGELNSTTTGFFVDPVRNVSSNNVLYYNTATKEITFGAASSGGGSTTLISDVRSFIANSGQTVFTVPTYVVGENRIRVFVNGVRQNNVVDYTETGPTTITLNPAADAGDNVVFEITAFDGALNPNQNTWINNTDTFAKMAAFTANAAYNTANTPPTRGITTDASYYPVFVDANNSTASVESLHTNLNLNYNPSTSLLFVSSANILSLGVGTAPSPTGGDIRASNNITAFFSDERLKINIKPIDNALEKIQEISGVYYNTNELARTYGYTDTSEHVGVIAQQIQSVLPHAVKPAPFDTDFDKNGNIFSKSGENYLTVQYEKLIPLLIQAIKEQQEQIDELKRNAK